MIIDFHHFPSDLVIEPMQRPLKGGCGKWRQPSADWRVVWTPHLVFPRHPKKTGAQSSILSQTPYTHPWRSFPQHFRCGSFQNGVLGQVVVPPPKGSSSNMLQLLIRSFYHIIIPPSTTSYGSRTSYILDLIKIKYGPWPLRWRCIGETGNNRKRLYLFRYC